MIRTESCLKTKSLTRPVMISNNSATNNLRSSRGTCDFIRSRSHNFFDRAMVSAFGLAALRSCVRTFCFACVSLEDEPDCNN